MSYIDTSRSAEPVFFVDASGNQAGTPANPLTISAAATQDVTGSGTLNAAVLNQAITIPVPSGSSVIAFSVSGLTASGATLTVQSQVNGGGYKPSNTTASSATSSLSSTVTADNADFRMGLAGRGSVQVIVSAVGTGTINLTWDISTAPGAVFLVGSLPQTNGSIGGVTVVNPQNAPVYNQQATSGTTPVAGSFTATSNSALFTAIPGHAVWVKLSGTFVGTVQVQRCSDGTATTAQAITIGGNTYAQFTAPCQEAVSSEDDTGVAYRLACTAFTSGTITYQIGHK